MLITFKSKAAADVIMYERHAKPMLDVLHKDLKRGVITPEEMASAIATLEARITESKETDQTADADDDLDDFDAPSQPKAVALSVRAFPLLEMMRAAKKSSVAMMWGV